jgi:arsenate reductase-like glutaredoxin family protein
MSDVLVLYYSAYGFTEAFARWSERPARVIERPIVVDEEKGTAVIGRPAENVQEFLVQ